MSPFGISSLVYVMQKSNASYYFDFFGAKASAKTSGELDATYVNVFNEAPPSAANDFVEARLNSNGFFLNGHRHLAFDPSTITGDSSSSTITLFGRNGSWKQAGTTCSISAAKIWMNGELVRDMIPCQVTSGEVRMYDRKNGSYYQKVNGGGCTASFEAGPEIDPVPSDAGVPASRSRTLVFAPTLTVVSNAKDKGTVVSISEGHDAGILMAVASKTDAGTASYSGWTESFYAATVAANENQVTVQLPRTWWKNHYQVRFVWVSKACESYDRELSCLHSDNEACASACLLTGWTPRSDTSAEFVARADKDVCVFGITGDFYLFHNADNKLYAGFGDQKTASGVAIDDPVAFAAGFHTLKLSATGAVVDDQEIATFGPATMLSATKGVSIPFRAVADTGSLGKTGNVEVKSAKLWDGDFLGLDLVPCVKDGVVGFYDRVRGTFNNGKKGGDFAAGETVVADGDALAWSPSVDLQWGMILFLK